MMGRSRESRRAPAAAAFTSARVTPVVAILLLASALPGALASDYEGDYALYSGHHAKCSSVMYGVSQPAVQVSNTAFRDDSIFYARFHVRTPYRFLPERPSDHSGSQPNSTTYNLFVFGGSDAVERGCDGWFGGVEADPHDSKRGYLFFGHRDCSTDTLTKYVGTERWVWNGESTRVEFSYLRANSTLRMYVDGELTYENFAASLPVPSHGPLSIGVGGHASTSSTIDAWDSGGCFSPNVPNWSPRDGARPDAEPECETRNRWDEIDGGDLLWCPSGWTGAAPSPKPVQPSRAAFKPSDGGCDAQLFAPHAPMYTKDSSEAWQRNRLRTKYAADPTKVDLHDLGEYPDFEDKFVYARFSFTTPEYFGRPHHSWGGYDENSGTGDYARGKIRLFGMGTRELANVQNDQGNLYASCVSLVAVSPPGVPPDAHIPIRQLYNRAKIVIHECSENKTIAAGDETYAKNFEVTSSYLEPSTSYLLEIKYNYRSSEGTVDVYLQGRMVASGPYDFFPCKAPSYTPLCGSGSLSNPYPHSVWFGDNAPSSYSFPHVDDNDWPGVVSAGNPGEVSTFMTDWGGLFSRAWSADGDPSDDWACVHDGKCGYLTGAQGTWGNWTGGELHFCPYPPDGPVAPTFDRDMYVATHACENCFPANESLGSGVLIGPFVGLTDADSIADDRLFRVVSATMSGADAGGDSAPARVARFFSHTDQPAQQQFCEAWAQDLLCYAVDDQSQCASSPSSTCQWHRNAGSGWCGTSGEAEETLRHYLDARPRRYGDAFEACNGMSGDPTACDADSECEYISSWNSCEPTRTALEVALTLDGASEGAVAYHSLYHHECWSHEEESVCVADDRCQYEAGWCKLRDEYWFTSGANACVDTTVDFRVVAQSYNTTLEQAFVAVGVQPARGVLSEDYPLAIGTASYIVWTCDAAARELKMVKVTFRDRDGVVRAVADGASTWLSADSNVDDDEFCNLRDYVVNERWEDASSASTPTSVATGHDAQGLGVSSIVVEAYLPVEVFSTTPNDFDTFATTGEGTSLRDPHAMPVMGYLAGGGLRGEHGGSIVHVMDANETSAACDSGASGRRRALLQKRREPSSSTVAAAAAGKKTERARRRRTIESSTRRPSTTTATTRTPSRNARGRALLQGPSVSWPSQADACTSFELLMYCSVMSGGDQADQASCEGSNNSPCTWNNPGCLPTSSSVIYNFMAIQQMEYSVFGAQDDACQQDTSCAATYCVENDYGTGCELSGARKYELLQAESDPNIPDLVMKMWEIDASVETCEATAVNPQDCEVNSIQEAQASCQGTGTGPYFDEILNAIGGGGSNSDSLYDSLIARYANIQYYSVAEMCAAWEIQLFCSATSGSQAECTHSECRWGLRSIIDDPSHSECLADNPTFNSTYVEMQWKIRSLHADQDDICRQRSSSDCTSDTTCAFMSDWGSSGECAASYSFITDAVANDNAPLHIQTFAKLDNLDRLCGPRDSASCDLPECSYDSDRGSCETDKQYYIENALSTDACDSYADFSLLLAAFSDSGSPPPQPPQPPQDSLVGSTLWETSTNLTELTDAVGLVATCDYPSDDADLSGEGTMKMVLFNLTHDGARTLVKPLEAGEKANVAGCHYKVHDVDEVTAAWKCRTSATLATTASTPDAFSLRTITYLKSSVVSTRPYSQSDVEEAALEGVCDSGCVDQYVKHGFLDVA
jgi:hypothetical protein